MSISPTEDLKTLAEFEKSPREILSQVRRTGRPVIVTNRGKADVVVMDAAVYERHLKTANLARLLAEAEADVAAGRTRPVRAFLRDRNRV